MQHVNFSSETILVIAVLIFDSAAIESPIQVAETPWFWFKISSLIILRLVETRTKTIRQLVSYYKAK